MGVGSIATTGLQAALSNMETISNNIANVNTIGYKRSFVNFADIFMNSYTGNSAAIGMGTRVNSVVQDFSLGRIETSSNGTDLTLARDGFFVQRDQNSGLTSYTRAGRMNFDKNGYLNGFGGTIQGFPVVNGVVQNSGSLVDLQLPTTALPAQATSNMALAVNLNSNSDIITNPFSVTDPTTFNFRSDETIYDSLGNHYLASVFYVKTSDNNWSAQIAVDDNLIGSGSLAFTDTGTLSSSAGFTGLSWTTSNGAAPGTLNIDLTGSTQYAALNKFDKHSQDGSPSGQPIGCMIDENGCLNVSYSNGITQVAGQIAVARFNSNTGLAKAGEMSWTPTTESGTPNVDPNDSQGGFMVGSIEYSNVDLTQELVSLIDAQHDFQANAQAEQTYNQVLQTIENI